MVLLCNDFFKYATFLVVVLFFILIVKILCTLKFCAVYDILLVEVYSDMAENKFMNPDMMTRCVPMSSLQAVLGGKWKILILWYIAFYKVQRFNELMRRLDGITQSSLTKQLRELEQDGFLHREIYKEIPPKVEYSLTEMGQSFVPILNQMMLWSETNLCPPDYINPYGDNKLLQE